MKVLVSPYSMDARRHIGIAQSDDGTTLMAISLCCGHQLGWGSFVGAAEREGQWACTTCGTVALAMKDYRGEGFGEFAQSTMTVFVPSSPGSSFGEWANINRVKQWVANWLKADFETMDVFFEMVETS